MRSAHINGSKLFLDVPTNDEYSKCGILSVFHMKKLKSDKGVLSFLSLSLSVHFRSEMGKNNFSKNRKHKSFVGFVLKSGRFFFGMKCR